MKYCLTIIAILLASMSGFAQQRKVTGAVTEKSTGSPMPGVSVQAKNATVITDSTGQFSIQATPGENLIFTFIGMKTFTIAVPVTGSMAISLEENASDLNEVVVTGYQAQKKADLTGAVSVVDVKQIQDIPVGNPVKALQGRVPGVFITTDGSPSGGATVRIRGIGTLGNNDPLYVIDGVPTKRGLQELNPEDIASIQVLKDASSATIYGSRAANGVIIVTTKKAGKGFTRVDFDANLSTQYYNTKQKMLSAEDRGRAYWQAAVNDRANPNNNQIYQYDWNGNFDNPILNRVILPDFIDAANTMRPANTQWFDEISRTSVIQQYNIAVSSGGERGSALFSLGYYDNNGVVKASNNKKITARLNSEYTFLKNRLRIGENLNFTYIRNTLAPVGDIMFTALVQQPIVPVKTVDGGWGGPASGMTDRQNPVRLIEDNRQNNNHFFRVFGNVYADLDILKNLHFRSSVGVDYAGNYERTLRKSYVSGFLSDPANQVNTRQGYEGNWLWQNTLTYKLELGQHRLDFLAGNEQIQFLNQSFGASRQGYALENIDYSYIDAGSTLKDNYGSGSSYGLLSFFGKANYVYADRYLASVTVRRDGSSRFGREYRNGTFPAFSLGWRISEEAFMKDQQIVSDLKLRYGWGRTGNQEIANNATYALYSAIYGVDPTWVFDSGSAYDINGNGSGQLPSGFTRIQQANDSLKWEGTTESNFGIDFGLFGNKLTGSVDYFIKNTSDILISPGYLAVVGEGGNFWFNGASMRNKGLEVNLSYGGNITKEIGFNINGNFSTYRNSVTHLPTQVLASYEGNGTDKTILGRPIGSQFGWIADGIFKSQKEVDDAPIQTGKGIGRIRYKDLNGDGRIDDKDRDFFADTNPDFIYGLNVELTYKNFDLTFFLQGVQGISLNNSFKTYTDFSSLWVGTNWGDRTLQAWTPGNAGSNIPALTLVDRNNEGRKSTYFYENASYLKLRNIQLGYNLRNALRNTGVRNARVFIQGNNIATIKSKKYTAADPELPGSSFPIPSIITAGFNVSL